MLAWKPFTALLVTSGLIIGWMKISLLEAEKIIAVQQTQIIQHKNNNEYLEKAIGEQRDTVERILTINEKAGERLHTLSSKQQQVMLNNAELNAEINTLRQTEATMALEKPYARGLAAGERINKLMANIGGDREKQTSEKDTTNEIK